jgi:hypothetical protein
MNEPVPPIFLDEHWDLSAFASLADAATYVEAIDVLNDEYEAFDAEGQPLVLHASHWSDPVSITVNAEVSPQPDELARRLRRYIERVGPERLELDVPMERAPLRRLVQAVAGFQLR